MFSKVMNSIRLVRDAMIDDTPEKLMQELRVEHEAVKKHMKTSNPFVSDYCTVRHDTCRSCGLLVWHKDIEHRYVAANDVLLRALFQLEPVDLNKVLHKTDLELITEWRERTGKDNTIIDLCGITDEWVKENFSPGRFFEFGYRDNMPLLLDTYKAPVLVDGVFSGTKGNALNLSNRESDAYELLHHFINLGLAKKLSSENDTGSAIYLINDRRKSFDRNFPGVNNGRH